MELRASVFEALERGATVLTGNQRAARTLRHEFDLVQQQRGQTRWAPPAILAWDAWTADLWRRIVITGETARLLLNRVQELSVWRSIIAADPEWTSLVTVDALATMAADAWSRTCSYGGEGRLRGAGVSVDTRAFERWASAFEARCRAERYLTHAQLERTLAAAMVAGKIALASGGYVLVGFDAMTPAQQGLTGAIKRAGGTFERLQPAVAEAEPPTLLTAATEPEELAAAARWIRRLLEQQPGARIALIVPGLEGRRREIDRILRQVLAPELEDIGRIASGGPFEFSLGVPLAATGMGKAALDLLRWTTGPLALDAVSGLLMSPFFSYGSELTSRAAFDAYELRGRKRMLMPEMTLDALLRQVEGSRRAPHLRRLAGTLQAMRRIAVEDDPRAFAGWVDTMRALLAAAGWRGEEDSLSFQTRRRWESVLDEVATLDFTGVRVGLAEALAGVERRAAEALFAPESHDAPVQVMGPLEAAGSVFDAVWFAGAGDLGWPMAAGRTPLLAWQLQRELGIPGTDAAADGERVRRMTERIAASGRTVVFSYAQTAAAGAQRVSTSLVGLAWHKAEVDFVPAPAMTERVELDTFEDSGALPPVPDGVIAGGVNVLKAQAACGFRAFAEQRLWATGVDYAEAGMNARDRGVTVHAALEHFWREVRTQAALIAMTTKERREVLGRAVSAALPAKEGGHAWEVAYLNLQRQRLMRLLEAWLQGEIARKVPFEVKVNELQLEDVRVGPLRLTLRVDRVDETEFGDVIVDYKTGASHPATWLSDRPEEPQVPLYAVLAAEAGSQLAAVAFGQVRAGKDMTLIGYEVEPGVLLKFPRDVPSSLDAQIEAWRDTLTTLAVAFHDGDVSVRPKKYPETCQYCRQRLLCRLDLATLDTDIEDDEEEFAEEELG